jgi:S1-C subfamily serine protease
MRRVLMPLFLGCCSLVGGMLAVVFVPRLTPTVIAQPAAPVPVTPQEGFQGTPPVVVQGAVQGDPSRADVARLGDRFEQIARRVGPAVVAIEAVKPATKPGGKGKSVEESGSGVMIRVVGQRGVLALTNNHVVAQAPASQITVSLADSRILKPSQVWTDPESDIAILRLDDETLSTVTLGDSEGVRVGQWVLAFGSPFGLNQTVTHGIISARDRGQISLGSTIRIKDFLQTDAAINPGSSGGPLVNVDGEVVGINTAIASHSGSNSGVAFSIPINLVKRVMKQLLEKGTVARGYLGLQVAPSFEAADATRLGLDRAQGALVESIYPETPAAAAGLKPGDVVLEIDGTAIRDENHFINTIAALTAGQRVRLKVWRDRQALAVEAVVGDWSAGLNRIRSKPPERAGAGAILVPGAGNN